MTQKRYWNVGDPFVAIKAREVQIGLNKAGVYKRYDLTVTAPDTFQISASGFALLPDGVAVTEDFPTTLRISPLSPIATTYTVTARHTENFLSGGSPVVYAAELGYLTNDMMTNGIVLGWIEYPGGGVAITQPMIVLAPLVGDGNSPGGLAGGDLGGTYPDPRVVGIQTTPVSSTAPAADGDILITSSGTYTPTSLTSLVGNGIPSVNFNILGPSSDYTTPTNFVDGFRELGVATQLVSVTVSQEIAGSAGSTNLVIYKVDAAGVVTQITPTNSLVIPYTSGNYARITSNVFLPTTNVLGVNDRLCVRAFGLQTNGEDVSVNIVVAAASLPSPTVISADTHVTQTVNKTVFGTVPTYVGSIYLPATTLLSTLTRFVFGGALPAQTARIQLKSMSGTIVFDMTTAGVVAALAPLSNIIIPSAGFYEWWISSPSGGTAVFSGFNLVWAPIVEFNANFGANETTIGITPTSIGSLYLPVGTMQSSTQVVLEAYGPGTPTATLEIYKPDTTLLTTFTSSGVAGREVISLAAPIFISAAGFYNFQLYGDAVTTISGFSGLVTMLTV